MNITPDLLYQRYVTEQKSTRIIGLEFGVSHTVIRNTLRKFRIPIRTNSRKGIANRSVSTPKTNLLNRKFGKLSVVEYTTGGYLCCCDCGNKIVLRPRRLTHDGIKSCGCSWHKNGPDSPGWRGFGELSSSRFSRIKAEAKRRSLPFDITIEYAWNLLSQQNHLCAISGVSISCLENTASLDRIDSSYGYLVGNVQWVHKVVNEMKWDRSTEELIKWCRIIASAKAGWVAWRPHPAKAI